MYFILDPQLLYLGGKFENVHQECLIYKSLWGINAWHLSAASDIHSDGYCQYRAGWMDLCRNALPTII